ncbi:MAG: DUF2442 domain-containing protein [Verrucomicrobia bacterium]|nr:DUF2442 domain-containing protein [Verrucomicrobiota bacterium]MCH8513506.1 DUF2442 domain-containing protein [Kiritimatiellia bacterium]
MKHITDIQIPSHLHLRLRFDDGVEGELDFSDEPRTGVFESWNDPAYFKRVEIGERGRSLVWPGEVDLCADSLWLQVTGSPPETLFPALHVDTIHA